MFGTSKDQQDLERLIDNLARSYMRGHPKNSTEGRAELRNDLAEAASIARSTGKHRAVSRAQGYRSALVLGFPQEARREFEEMVAAALAA